MNRFLSSPRCLLALVVMGGLTTPAWAEDAPIKTPQAAVIVFTNGRSVSGTLLSIDEKTVRFQLPRKDSVPAVYQRTQIRGLRTADGVYLLDRTSGQFRKVTQTAPTKPTPKPEAPAPEIPAAQTVEAEGVDEDADKALQDAFRAAVRKVVGTMVDAETLVKDEKVIRDKVLTYSDGIIKGGYKELSRKRVEGLWHIKISATVVRRSLAARLLKANVIVKEVEGKDLAAAVMTRKEARAKATELLEKTLANLEKVMVAGPRKPDDRDYDEDEGVLRLDVVIRADPAKYKVFLERLVGVLDKVHVAKDFMVMSCKPSEVTRAGEIPTFSPEKYAENFAALKLPADQKGWYIWVLTNTNPLWTGIRWNAYLLDSDMQRSLKGLLGAYKLKIVLLDRDGGVLKEEEMSLDDTSSGYKWLLGSTRVYQSDRQTPTTNLVLAPLALSVSANYLNYQTVQMRRCKIKLSEDKLKRLKEIKCSVTFHPEK